MNQKQINCGTAPGKIILFGEHAVVYGEPAIAASIDIKSSCMIEKNSNAKSDEFCIIFSDFNYHCSASSLDKLKNTIEARFAQFVLVLEIYTIEYKTDFLGLKITISSNIWEGSGLGSSASTVIAMVKAIDSYFSLKLNNEIISNIGFRAEQIVHGNSSGIDNTICAFGGIIYYQSGEIEPLKYVPEISLLLIFTKIAHNTKEAVQKVKTLTQNEPETYNPIIRKIGMISHKAKMALQIGNLKEIGRLMNTNQQLLQKLQLSSKEIDNIITSALNNGADGAKITGAGLGGSVIIIGKPKNLENIEKLLKEKGYLVKIVKIKSENTEKETKR